jgi:hypothetical protein
VKDRRLVAFATELLSLYRFKEAAMSALHCANLAFMRAQAQCDRARESATEPLDLAEAREREAEAKARAALRQVRLLDGRLAYVTRVIGSLVQGD